MSTLTDKITAHFTPEQLAQVGGAELYLQQALARFNQDHPQLAVSTVTLTDSPIVPLPADWTEGFSRPYRIHYPVASAPVSVEPSTGSDGVTIDFALSDWTFSSGQYRLEITHGLESHNLITQFREGDIHVFPVVEIVTANKIRLTVSAKPDGRFAGTAAIERA